MSEPTTPSPVDAAPQPPQPPDAATPAQPRGLMRVWEHIQHHKVMHWTLAYAAAAYTLLHGVEMLSEAQEWPHMIVRVLSLVLVLGVPIVALLAWYHGHKAQHRISGPELAILTVLLFIAGSLLWAFSRSNGEHAEKKVETAVATTEATPAATPVAPRTAVAVLPFSNLTGDASKEYLGDGMAEAMINTLTKVPGLKVPARTSTFAYKGRSTDIRQIAKDLGVGTILEGSVQAAGKRLRITAQLINAQDGLHLWSETYDEEFTDIFKLQDKLATAISSALQPSLNGSAATIVVQTQPTQDVEAYDLYLQGWSLAYAPTEQNLKRAIDYFQQAIARDPKFAKAYDGLANARMQFSDYSSDQKVKDALLAAGESAAKQALALDPSIADAHMVLAGMSAGRGQFLELESHSRAALALGANDGFIYGIRAAHLEGWGRLREGLQEAQKGYALAPANPFVIAFLADLNSVIGHEADAAKYVGLAADLGYPKHLLAPFDLNTALRTKRYADATALLNKIFDVSDPEQARAAEVFRLVYAALADPSQRSVALAARTRLYPKTPAGSSAIRSNAGACLKSSRAYALLGEMDVAYDLSNQCLDQLVSTTESPNTGLDVWSPEMRPFRQDARFQGYLTRLGVMDIFQQYGPPDDCDLKDGKLTCH